MVNYENLYHQMVGAAEDAINAINRMDYGAARLLLIDAQRRAEELYLESDPGVDTHSQT